MLVTYLIKNKKIKTNESNSDVEIISHHKRNRHTVVLKVKNDITLVAAEHELPCFVNFKDLYFLNGYQSWTDTKEHYLKKRLRNINKSPHIITNMYALNKYGDSSFYKYSIKKSHGYDIFYSKGEFESFLYSLNFDTAYLIIELIKDRRNLFLRSDVEGITLYAGEEVTIFDYKYFLSYEEGIEAFEEDFPSLNKEKIFGYTSWYNYYQDINEEIILKDLDALDSRFNVFQIDDGYETFVGDWLDIDEKKFPNGLEKIVAKIHSKNYKAGIWLAPFAAETKSKLVAEHKDWLLKDKKGKPMLAGGNWSKFYALDFTNEEVRNYIKKSLEYYMNLGFDFFKLDFLYAAALNPKKGKSRCQTQKEAYEFLREILKDKIILGCGANIINSYKTFDYLRIGPDVSLKFDDVPYMRLFHRERISTKVTVQNTIYRHLFDQHLFGNDPDVFLLRDDNIELTKEQRKALTIINALMGSVLMTSDNIATYDEEKKAILDKAFNLFYNAKVTQIKRNGPSLIDIDYEINNEKNRLTYDWKKGVLVEHE